MSNRRIFSDRSLTVISEYIVVPDDDLAALLESKVEVAGPEDAVELVGYVEVLRPPNRQFLHEMFRV